MISRLLDGKVMLLALFSSSTLTFVAPKVLFCSLTTTFFTGVGIPLSEYFKEASEDLQDDQIYDVADKMPRPVGGQDGWEEYLKENMNYPIDALRARFEGAVYVVFILEKDGRTSNVQVLRGIGHGCDEEAVRLVEASPKWTPGENNGEPVRVRMRLPVRFHLPH